MHKTAIVAKVLSTDEELAKHLERAEEHLIEAVKLFERKDAPARASEYVTRLTRAQEMVTHLFGEELIRIRGPIKLAGKRRKK